jgi:hypothetical protein
MKIVKSISFISAIITCIFVMNSCMTMTNCLQGSGKIIKENRNPGEFNKVSLAGIGNIYVTQGNENALIVESDDNIIKHITTIIKGSTLIVDSDRQICPGKINLYVTMKQVEGLKIKGSGDIITKNKINSDKLALVLDGSGNIQADVEGSNVKCEINGSGDIRLNGKLNYSYYTINGSGNINSSDCEVTKCEVEIFGSGNAKVNVKEELNVKVFGSGDVLYKGEPKNVSEKVLGSGGVRRMN